MFEKLFKIIGFSSKKEHLKEEYLKKLKRHEEVMQLVTSNPELLSDVEFMSELVKENFGYINLDKTNNHSVYVQALGKAYEELKSIDVSKSTKYNFYETEGIYSKGHFDLHVTSYNPTKSYIENLISELDNPKPAPEGKYKISHEHLFREIRQVFGGNINNPRLESVHSYIGRYLDLDCNLPKEYGEKIESLYTDPDNYLMCHTQNYDGWNNIAKWQIDERRAAIFKIGLRTTTRDCDGGNSHVWTMIGNHQKNVTYLELLEPLEKIIFSVPKTCFDRQNPTPMWGADTPIVTAKENPGYVLPEFVIGAVDKENATFQPNPIPVEQRK